MGEPPEWTSVYGDRSWRCCWLEDGTPKKRYTRAEAKRVSDRMRREGQKVTAYWCPVCKTAWHIGH